MFGPCTCPAELIFFTLNGDHFKIAIVFGLTTWHLARQTQPRGLHIRILPVALVGPRHPARGSSLGIFAIKEL